MSNVFHRSLTKSYPTAVRGEGIYLYDETGKRYLDGCSGALVSNVGHGNREVLEGILRQMQELEFAHTSQFTNAALEEYASLIAQVAPGDMNYVYFLSGGSEANETAMKMARQYFLEKGKPSKYKIIGRWPSYHGNTLGTLSAGGHTQRRRPFTPQLMPFPHIEAPDWYREPDGDPVTWAMKLDTEIRRQGPDQVAAFIMEAVTGTSNAASYSPKSYYETIREICDHHDVLLIVDEVMTGFGRTGAYFACEHFGLVPDLITTGKGISGGYSPLAAVLVREPIYEAFRNGSGRFSHGHTYVGNPISTRAGLEVLKYLMKHRMTDHVRRVGAYLLDRLKACQSDFPIIGDVRGLGLMIGLEIVADPKTKEPFPAQAKMADKITQACFENGLLVYPGSGHIQGDRGDSLLIAPPFVITEEQADELVELLRRSLATVTPK